MRLRKQQIESIAYTISEELTKEGAIKCNDKDELKGKVRKLITDELTIEDKLNEEVHKILEEHSAQIRQGSIEYHKMFRLVKEKLAKDRNIIL